MNKSSGDPGFNLTVDCLSRDCARERTFAVADLATFYGGGRTVGDVLRRMRCSGACGGRVGAAWLVTGPVLNARVRPRRVALVGEQRPAKQSAEAMGRRLLVVVVYDKRCRIGATLTLDDLAETAIGDRKMPQFRAACTYAVQQGWLIVEDDTLMRAHSERCSSAASE